MDEAENVHVPVFCARVVGVPDHEVQFVHVHGASDDLVDEGLARFVQFPNRKFSNYLWIVSKPVD